MNKLNLAPLPTIRDDEENAPRSADMHGFVDDAVIQSIMTGPVSQRNQGLREDLALSADDDDFAGWHFTAPSPFREMAETSTPLKTSPPRRAVAPVYTESGIGTPHTGSHRWWVAGFGGALTTLLLSYLLITLAHRPMPENSADMGAPLVVSQATWNQPAHQDSIPPVEVTTTSIEH